MVYNRHKCDKLVLKCFRFVHCKCNKYGHTIKTGSYLNRYLSSDGNDDFESKKKYQVCKTMSSLFDSSKVLQEISQSKPTSNNVKVRRVVSPISMTKRNREERLTARLHAKNGLMTEKDMMKVKHVKISCDGGSTIYVRDYNGCKENEVKERRHTWLDKVKLYSNEYRYPYSKLTIRERFRRIDDIGMKIIAACLDRKIARDEGIDYIIGNESFGHEVLNILHGLKERIELKLKLDLQCIAEPKVCELVEKEDDILHLTNDLEVNQNETMDIAIAITEEVSSRGYERIRKKLSNVMELPSQYKLRKNLPIKILPMSFTYNTHILDKNDDARVTSRNEHTGNDCRLQLLLGDGNNGPGVMLPPAKRSSSDAMLDHISNMKYDGDTVIGAKIEGTMEDYINLMRNKHISKGRKIDGEDLILISSFDGAEIMQSNKQKRSVISFSSSLITASMINKRQVTSGQTSNILTWQQVLGKEDKFIMQQSLTDYFEGQQRLLHRNSEDRTTKIFCYNCHDGKMIYQLVQCSQWNRKHHPFIICKCKRNQGVLLNNGTHQCCIFSDKEYRDLWHRSKRRFAIVFPCSVLLVELGFLHFDTRPYFQQDYNISIDVFLLHNTNSFLST